MAEVELTEDTLVVHVKGMDRIFALTSRLDIPLSHVMGAQVDPELGHPEWWKSLRFTATQIPWVVSAGTFYQEAPRTSSLELLRICLLLDFGHLYTE
jgi:hypothetical protein